MKNIVLIGMPGAGKSTIGVVLAKSLGLQFVDTDLQIQNETHRLLQDIINKNGLDIFLSIENDVILHNVYSESVIATGGSVVYSQTAMAHLTQNSLCIFLSVPYPELEKRLDNITTRGIAMGQNQTLLDLFKERQPFYEKYADITIDCSSKTVESIVTDIVTQLNKASY